MVCREKVRVVGPWATCHCPATWHQHMAPSYGSGQPRLPEDQESPLALLHQLLGPGVGASPHLTCLDVVEHAGQRLVISQHLRLESINQTAIVEVTY